MPVHKHRQKRRGSGGVSIHNAVLLYRLHQEQIIRVKSTQQYYEAQKFVKRAVCCQNAYTTALDCLPGLVVGMLRSEESHRA